MRLMQKCKRLRSAACKTRLDLLSSGSFGPGPAILTKLAYRVLTFLAACRLSAAVSKLLLRDLLVRQSSCCQPVSGVATLSI